MQKLSINAHMGEEVKPSKSSERIVGGSPEALYEPSIKVSLQYELDERNLQ
jgi:hypothetical protein